MLTSAASSSLQQEAIPEGRGHVSLRGVRKAFGAFEVVKGVDLNVSPGEFLSLLGPSGCGKTTVLRMLAGFEDVTSGDIRISGKNVRGIPPYRRDINTVFQSYALFPHMSVADNVAYGLRQQRVSRDDVHIRVKEALDSVRMTSFATRKPSMLSGGQQQRVALARSLVNRPSVLLLDEPLAALDRKLREEMQVELKLLQSTLGTTFIFVTHDQEEALSMSDRIAVMNFGRIVQIGEPGDIYDHPADEFVADFIGRHNFLVGSANSGFVETAEGALKTTPPIGDASGNARSMVVAVRPEAIMVCGARNGNHDNEIGATLIGLSVLGDHVRYICTTAAGIRIIAKRPRSENHDLKVGQPIWCTFSAESTRVFPRRGTCHSAS